MADAIEIVMGQGAKPGGGGLLLGQKVGKRVSGLRDPVALTIESAAMARVPLAGTDWIPESTGR